MPPPNWKVLGTWNPHGCQWRPWARRAPKSEVYLLRSFSPTTIVSFFGVGVNRRDTSAIFKVYSPSKEKSIQELATDHQLFIYICTDLYIYTFIKCEIWEISTAYSREKNFTFKTNVYTWKEHLALFHDKKNKLTSREFSIVQLWKRSLCYSK